MQLLLTLLRIIGILVLAVILLVLLVVLLVMLCPVRYKAIILRELEKQPEGKVRIHWLLHFISVHVNYREKLSYRVKILGITILKADDVPAPKDGAGKNVSGDAGSGAVDPGEDGVGEISAKEGSIDQGAEGEQTRNSVSETPPSDGRTPSVVETPVNEEKMPFLKRIGQILKKIGEIIAEIPERIAALLEKIAELLEKFAEFEENLGVRVDQLLEKIDGLMQKKERLLKQIQDEQNRSAVTAVFGTLGGLLTHLRPTKLKIKGRLGFDDPATTGQVFGILGMLMPLYGENIQLEAVFEEAVMEGRLEVRGRIRLGTLVVLAVKLILKKEVRRLITQMKRLKQG